MDWSAYGLPNQGSVVIVVGGIEKVCILQEQVIHGLDYCKGDVLKSELRLSYTDILEDLGIE